ncbi:hypothetical protein L0337_06515, partial [candidate division KSB1 bacterium]|nr:hypothetical protein [candidate division KSB1 bacterium]
SFPTKVKALSKSEFLPTICHLMKQVSIPRWLDSNFGAQNSAKLALELFQSHNWRHEIKNYFPLGGH